MKRAPRRLPTSKKPPDVKAPPALSPLANDVKRRVRYLEEYKEKRWTVEAESAWGALLEIVDGPLDRFLLGRCGASDMDARRNAIAACYAALRKHLMARSAKPIDRPWGWLMTVSRNGFINGSKKRAHERQVLRIYESADYLHERDDGRPIDLPRHELEIAEWEAHRELIAREAAGDHWDVLRLYYTADAKGRRQLAHDLGITGAALRSRIKRARPSVLSAIAAFKIKHPRPEG